MAVLKVKRGNEWVDVTALIGPQGIRGPTGSSGPKGDPGPKGDTGNPGADGVTFTPIVSAEGVISWTNDGERENPESVNIKGPQGEPGLSSPLVVNHASGAVASFADGADGWPVRSIVVGIEPVQSGSGDPSPENVRPISGWTGANVTKSGINIWNEEWEQGHISSSQGTDSYSTDRIRSKGYIPVSPGQTYYFNIPNADYVVSCWYDAGKTYISGSNTRSRNRTAPQGASYMRFSTDAEYGGTYNNNISINYPKADTVYHPGYVQSVTIPFGQTVYGGTLDVINGVLTVDRANIESYNGETLPGAWISDRDVYAEGTTPTTGAQVVYELAIPTTYQLTPAEITSLFGANNIWADCGGISVDYCADTKTYVDESIPAVPVQDICVNGTSILSDGVANVKIKASTPLEFTSANGLSVATPGNADVKSGSTWTKALTPELQHASAFYGLAKAAGDTTQASSNNAVGNYTDTAKSNIQNMLGVSDIVGPRETDYIADKAYVVGECFTMNGLLYTVTNPISLGGVISPGTNCSQITIGEAFAKKTDIPSVPVQDVQVNGTSVLNDGVANIPVASSNAPGVVMVDQSYGIIIHPTLGYLAVNQATDNDIKAGTIGQKPIVPYTQHASAFYGLAKAAGDSTQSASDNAVGTYTDSAKSAIRSMIGAASSNDIPSVPVQDVQVNGTSVLSNGVANVPLASHTSSSSTPGVVKIGYYTYGLYLAGGELRLNIGYESTIKSNGSGAFAPINMQHAMAFYGLSRAAGDTTQSASDNAIGNYTESAKSAISQMLNAPVTVSGTTPSITAKAGVQYVCGEVSTLTIVVPASGCIDVIFESGSTPTALTVTPPTGMTMKWPDLFNPTALKANTTYEINILNGNKGVVMEWT